MKQKIMDLAKRIGADKWGHFILFTYVYITLLMFFSPLVALIITNIAAAAVELIYDKWWGKGTPEFLDWVASVVGPIYIYIVIAAFL